MLSDLSRRKTLGQPFHTSGGQKVGTACLVAMPLYIEDRFWKHLGGLRMFKYAGGWHLRPDS